MLLFPRKAGSLLTRVAPLVLLAFSAVAQSPSLPARAPAPSPGHETLEYDVEWRLWNAGKAKLDWSPAGPSKGFESKLHLESTGIVSRMFHVSDDYTADMTANLCAITTYMTAREGNRSRDTKVTFDGATNKAAFLEKDLKTNAVLRNEIDVPTCVHDIIGGLYLLRQMNLEPGKTTQIPVSNGKKSIQLKIESQGREDIKTPSGTAKAIRYEVFAFDNQLYARPGHLHIWLSDDKRRLPVQIQIRLQFAIGTITLRLNKETFS